MSNKHLVFFLLVLLLIGCGPEPEPTPTPQPPECPPTQPFGQEGLPMDQWKTWDGIQREFFTKPGSRYTLEQNQQGLIEVTLDPSNPEWPSVLMDTIEPSRRMSVIPMVNEVQVTLPQDEAILQDWGMNPDTINSLIQAVEEILDPDLEVWVVTGPIAIVTCDNTLYLNEQHKDLTFAILAASATFPPPQWLNPQDV